MSKLVKTDTAILAKSKGFDLKCDYNHCDGETYNPLHNQINRDYKSFVTDRRGSNWDYIDKGFLERLVELVSEGNALEWDLPVPTQTDLQTWLREKHKIEVYVIPVFREKCGYDSFKRDGWTFEVITAEPCQFLTWSDFNQCGEDRDEEIQEEGELICLKPSFESFEEAFEQGLIEGTNLVNQ
ncbi:MAG: hypothetical protein ACTSQA_06810 [Candidatus Heimdallarchaeaceae archaeon]